MYKPSRRTRVLLLALLVPLVALVWWGDVASWLPSREVGRVEAMRTAFERDYDALSREERGRRYRELMAAEQALPEARRRAYAWDQAQERHLDHVAQLRRFHAMTADEKTRALDEAIEESREALARTAAAQRRAKAPGSAPAPPAEPVEAGRPIVFTAEEVQLRDNYAQALQDRKAQLARPPR